MTSMGGPTAPTKMLALILDGPDPKSVSRLRHHVPANRLKLGARAIDQRSGLLYPHTQDVIDAVPLCLAVQVFAHVP